MAQDEIPHEFVTAVNKATQATLSQIEGQVREAYSDGSVSVDFMTQMLKLIQQRRVN